MICLLRQIQHTTLVWYKGTMVQRHYGTKAQWYKGTMVQRHYVSFVAAKVQAGDFIDIKPQVFPSQWWVNSSPPSDAYMHQWIGSSMALVQIIACCLFSTMPLSEPMLEYCQLDSCEQTSVKFKTKYETFHWWKYVWKYHLRNGSHVVEGKMS